MPTVSSTGHLQTIANKFFVSSSGEEEEEGEEGRAKSKKKVCTQNNNKKEGYGTRSERRHTSDLKKVEGGSSA